MPPGQAIGQRVPSLVETDIGQSGLLEWSCHLLFHEVCDDTESICCAVPVQPFLCPDIRSSK